MSSFSNRFNSKKIVFAIFILISCLSFAQDKDAKIAEIKALYDKSYKSYTEYQYKEALEYSKKANELALKLGESEWVSKTYNGIANAYTNMGKQKEALAYIEKAMAEEFTKTDLPSRVKLLTLKANNHSLLGLDDVGNKEYLEALDLLKNENTDPKMLLQKIIIFHLLSHNSFKKQDYKTSLKYENAKIELLKKFPEEEKVMRWSETYNVKGDIFLETKKLDSAYYYFSKALELKKKHNDPVLYSEYRGLGNYYSVTGNQEKALENYLKMVENLKGVDTNEPALIEVYKTISGIYGEMGQKDKESFYLKKYTEESNKLQQSTKEGTEEAVKIILKDKEEKFNTFQSKSFLTIGAIVFGAALLIFGLFVWYKKTSKKREKVISETQELLAEKEEIIEQKEEETQELKLKVNESFEEVIHLAKNNSPEFWGRFQEVYPEFRTKLLEINPDLKPSELTLCAYILLGFNTKDIAEYTFKAEKTIRNNKYNLRKRLDIQTKSDFTVWLRNYIEN